MDDFSINEPIFCCDVAMLEPFLSASFDPDKVTKLLTREYRFLSQSIGKVLPSGTCFIIAKPKTEIKLRNKKVVGLALTNYHISYNLENRSKHTLNYVEFKIDNRAYYYQYQPMFELNSLLADVQRSHTTGMEYCLPNDVSVILLIDKACQDAAELEELEMYNEGDLMNIKNVLVSGFPVQGDYNYILPGCEMIPDYKNKIIDGFHGYISQVISECTIQITDSGLAELQVSSTSGMSGSPLLVKLGGKYKYVGIYCGGPPIEGQRDLMTMLDYLNKGENEKAKRQFELLPFDDENLFFYCTEFIDLTRSFYKYMVLKNMMEPTMFKEKFREDFNRMVYERNTFSEQHCLAAALIELQVSVKKMLFATVKSYKERSKLSFNSGIAIGTEAFQIVKRAIETFKQLSGEFQNENDLENLASENP